MGGTQTDYLIVSGVLAIFSNLRAQTWSQDKRTEENLGNLRWPADTRIYGKNWSSCLDNFTWEADR